MAATMNVLMMVVVFNSISFFLAKGKSVSSCMQSSFSVLSSMFVMHWILKYQTNVNTHRVLTFRRNYRSRQVQTQSVLLSAIIPLSSDLLNTGVSLTAIRSSKILDQTGNSFCFRVGKCVLKSVKFRLLAYVEGHWMKKHQRRTSGDKILFVSESFLLAN